MSHRAGVVGHKLVANLRDVVRELACHKLEVRLLLPRIPGVRLQDVVHQLVHLLVDYFLRLLLVHEGFHHHLCQTLQHVLLLEVLEFQHLQLLLQLRAPALLQTADGHAVQPLAEVELHMVVAAG